VDTRHHGMASSKAAGEGEGLQIHRVTENVLNKQDRTADRGGLPGSVLGEEQTTPHRKQFRNTTHNFGRPKRLNHLVAKPERKSLGISRCR
jgi:hypothetical protein